MDKLVFITGASSGIGQALAARYHRAGWRLALVARRTLEIKSWAEASGISANSYEIYSANVAQPDSIAAAGQECLQRQGVPDVVIANAGISIGMDTATREDLDVPPQTFATTNTRAAATLHPFHRVGSYTRTPRRPPRRRQGSERTGHASHPQV